MFPIILDSARLKIMLVGNGGAALRRLKLLRESGASEIAVFAGDPSPELAEVAGENLIRRLPVDTDFRGVSLVMIADFSEEISGKIAGKAKGFGILTNVEDSRKYCDYHVPAIVRRGDFLLTVSTNGASPRLARRVRQILEKLFPQFWGERVKEIRILRKKWKNEGNDMPLVAKKTDEWLEENSLLKNLCKTEN